MKYDFNSRDFLLNLLKENETEGQNPLAQKYGVSRYKIRQLLEAAKKMASSADATSNEAEDSVGDNEQLALSLYKSWKGVNCSKVSKAQLQRDHNVSRRKLDKLLDLGREAHNKGVVDASSGSAKQFAAVVSVDFADYTPEQIREFQRRVAEGEISKRGLGAELNLSRYKTEKLLSLKIETFKDGEITSISTKRQEASSIFPGTVFLRNSSVYLCVMNDVEGEVLWAGKCGQVTGEEDYKLDKVNLYDLAVKLAKNNDDLFMIEHYAEDGDELDDSRIPNYVQTVSTDDLVANAYDVCAKAERLGWVVTSSGKNSNILSGSDVVADGYLTTENGKLFINQVDSNLTRQAVYADEVHDIEKEVSSNYDASTIKPGMTNGYRCYVTSKQISITRLSDGKVETINHGHKSFAKVSEAVKRSATEEAFNLIGGDADVKEYVGEHVTWSASSNVLMFHKRPDLQFESPELCERFRRSATEGSVGELVILDRFVGKMIDNPIDSIIERIPKFMAFGDVQICEDGDLYVYKAVNGRYRDDYTDEIDNSPGSIVFMDHSLIDPSTTMTCTQGLHVCSLDYVNQMTCYSKPNMKIIRVKLNPADIVAIPNDYGNRKIRCCRYESVADVTSQYRSGELKADKCGVFL